MRIVKDDPERKIEGGAMSIDRLNRAAQAAGFAMAAPDDEPVGDARWVTPPAESMGRGIVAVAPKAVTKLGVVESVLAFAARMRSAVPTIGGRAPA